MKDFKDKTIVITGAGSGMGRAYALEFARLGARLALNDFDPAGLAETVALLKGTPARGVFSQVFDVGDKAAMNTFAAEVQAELGNAHVIINNAGVGGGGMPVWAMEDQSYERTLQINFFGVVYGTRAFLPQLLANGEGAIVNVSSVFGLVGTPNASDYCASKFAVRGFTESLMVELQESPISVHLVHPGGINTNIAKDSPNGEEFTRKYLKTDPDDVAREVIECIRSGKQRLVLGYQSLPLWLMSWGVSLERRNRLLYAMLKGMLDPKLYSVARRKAP
ncbi:SDR family NAD(P)-dependent oxidoreductase [Pseudomonas sp. N040]|uniref:SDR family NAD(P)-dependent oxidoreductase n=1 Tax=Pseudomonas sp. N040 TaxID=2785325 RepID=UPI0018A2B6A3|nr:SDR family oxidoreductase [Pseudomonas sp. N040]MBF7729611.1 SDR family oxidoreductase [Pseudomonas sp. N040]MBW7013251.1 SDR family oxidoreductase [Pseudomonas sp. N040]